MDSGLNDKSVKIALHDNRGFTIVDSDVEFFVSQYSWTLAKGRKTFYARAYVHGGSTPTYLHHFILGTVPPRGYVVDHINGDGLDNRRENLRVVKNGENIRRAARRGSGVYYIKRLKSKPWRAEAKVDDVAYFIGYFATEEEAIEARRVFLINKGVSGLDK